MNSSRGAFYPIDNDYLNCMLLAVQVPLGNGVVIATLVVRPSDRM